MSDERVSTSCLFIILTVSLTLLGMVSCTSQPRTSDELLAVITDREQATQTRLDALAAASQSPSEAYRSTLEATMLAHAQPLAMHEAIFEKLIADDEPATRRFLRKHIRHLPRWEVVDLISNQAAERQWADFIPALIHSLSEQRAIPDPERAEWLAIESLAHQPVETMAEQILSDPALDASSTERAAAWHFIARTYPEAQLPELVQDLPTGTPTVADLHFAYEQYRVIPVNRFELTWIRWLRLPIHRSFQTAARAGVARLNADQLHGLAPRHLPLIAWLEQRSDPLLTRSRVELHRDQRRSSSERVYGQEATAVHPGDDVHYPQQFSHWAEKLNWGDLLVLTVLRRALAEPDIVTELFAQADRDLRDTAGEHGGHLIWSEDGKFIARHHASTEQRHDLEYITPHALVLELYTGFVHYHFHAQTHQNSSRARPGLGDRRLADRLRINGLVLTFIDENTLNTDYYAPQGIVIDLGLITRP